MYGFFAFRSRANAINFYETLLSRGINAELINTPSAAQLGCGLSVQVRYEDIETSSEILSQGYYTTFKGLFSLYQDGCRTVVGRIK